MNLTSNFLKSEIGKWIENHTNVIEIDKKNWEIGTIEIDSYGDTIYCFVSKENNYYKVSDDGRLLFKLDPGQEDKDLYQTAEEIVLGAGFDFDTETCEISILSDFENLAQAIQKLSQLQVAISYLN